jgi:cell shape-determining protein MreD
LGPALAAVGAGLAALLEATTASRYQFAGSQLQILLVFAVAVTVVFGFEMGMASAFVGGLLADFLTLRPLGSTVFELLVVVGFTDVSAPLLARARYPGCIAAVFVLTPVYLVVSDMVAALLQPPAPTLRVSSLIIAAVVNAVVAALAAPLVIGLKRRAEQRERVLWWR